MAVPKHKTSKSRRDQRRTHDAIKGPGVTTCEKCNEPKLPHHACPSCGDYKGRTVIPEDED